MSRKLLSRRKGTKQVLMVTDGEPTAYWPRGVREPLFAYPPTNETVDSTLAEVARCTADGIRISTFALDATGHLRTFIEQLSRLNHGKAFFTSPESLGDYVLLHSSKVGRHPGGAAAGWRRGPTGRSQAWRPKLRCSPPIRAGGALLSPRGQTDPCPAAVFGPTLTR